ncbi:MAG: hypothetical protein MJ175_12360, partial [Clostridia bacterium]|nr:hypothetical protein [Clostridia bacterium]
MPETNEKLKIADNIFAAACAISPRFYGSVYVLMFNRDMARELDLPDFYSMVLDGTWTHDRFFSVAREAVSDLNGDGKMDEQDRYGFIYDYSVADAMVIGAGMRYVENNNGRLRLTLEDAPVVDYVQKLADFFQEPCCGYDDNGVRYFMGEDFVHNGTVLFYGPCTFNLASYRDLTYDYGILPMPKLDEGQDAYYCYSQPWATACPIIPITLTGADLDRVGTLTDAMAAYGYDYVRPAVFDNVIQLKSARDEQSAQIIDMMFENVTFEYVSFFRFGKMFDAIHNFYSTNLGKKDIVSTYAAVKASAESEVEKLENHILEFVAALE